MKDLVKKVAVGLTTGALLSQSMLTSAFGSIDIIVTGNAQDTNNNVSVTQTNATVVTQNNNLDVDNDVDVDANTGNNDQNGNNGGDNEMTTGDATATVDISTGGNVNQAEVGCNTCTPDISVDVSNNAQGSNQDIDLTLTNSTHVTQDNDADVDNDVDVDLNSGWNNQNKNNGGDNEMTTGDLTADVTVKTWANANVAVVSGGDEGGALDIQVTGNGQYSTTDLDLIFANAVVLDQENDADVDNDVDVDGDSGYNDQYGNNGGETKMTTGDVDLGVILDTMVNFNAAFLDECCLDLDGTIKVANNAQKSDTYVDLTLTNSLHNTQDNDGDVDNDADLDGQTGKNDQLKNNGGSNGDPEMTTGDSDSTVEIETTGNENILGSGELELGDWEDFGGWDWSAESSGMLVWFMALFS